jgi:hypothetical protein
MTWDHRLGCYYISLPKAPPNIIDLSQKPRVQKWNTNIINKRLLPGKPPHIHMQQEKNDYYIGKQQRTCHDDRLAHVVPPNWALQDPNDMEKSLCSDHSGGFLLALLTWFNCH